MGPISAADKTNLKIDQINNQTVTLPTALSNGNYMNLAGNETEINTRMAKNDDWGAIAYLSASSYGTGVSDSPTEPGAGDSSNPGQADGGIRINANSSYVTGCGPIDDAGSTGTYSGGLTCTSGSNKSYYTGLGQLASTTKNVYGIYDMSGGLYEYVMAVYSDASGNPVSGNYCSDYDLTSYSHYFSGFKGVCNNGTSPSTTAGIDYPDPKYYNLYNRNTPFNGDSSTNNRKCNWATCGGQALHEVWTGTGTNGTSNNRRWNYDYASFVDATYPWFIRGGGYYDGSYAGVFYSGNTSGNANTDYGWRLLMSAF
jgi:hypothetical protein